MSVSADRRRTGRRDERKAERRAEIVMIAAACFLENGYARTTMSAIAKRSGGSKGTLWTYFESKEALFQAVIETIASAFRKELLSILDHAEAPETALLRFADSFIDKITGPQSIAFQRMIIGECAHHPEIGRTFFEHAPGATRIILAAYLERHMAEGRLRQADPFGAADVLLSLCGGGLHERVLWGVEAYDRNKAAAAARTVVEQFLRLHQT